MVPAEPPRGWTVPPAAAGCSSGKQEALPRMFWNRNRHQRVTAGTGAKQETQSLLSLHVSTQQGGRDVRVLEVVRTGPL